MEWMINIFRNNIFYQALLVLFIISLVFREFRMWYWKQNKIVSLLEEMNEKFDVLLAYQQDITAQEFEHIEENNMEYNDNEEMEG